jgi:hypothetical protein
MNRTNRVLLVALVSFCGGGCEESAPQPAAQRLTAPPADVTTQEGVAPAPAPETSTSEIPTPPAASGGIAQTAFLAANERVMAVSTELLRTLDGVTDESSAQAAAPKLRELTPQWKSTAELATAAFLALPDEEESAVMAQAMQSTATQLQEAGRTHGPDLPSQIQRIAKTPAGQVLQNELIALRDAFLTTRGPYSPVTARRRMEEKLGPVGSPIKTD